MSCFAYGESFEEVLDKAFESNLVKSKQFEIKSFEGEIIKAKSFQNPEVYTEFGRVISKGNGSINLTEFSISQPLSLYGIRNYRILEAKSFLESAKYNFEMFSNEYKSKVYELFYESLYRKELLEISKQEYEFSKSIYEFVKKTYDLGEISKIDLFRSEKDFNLARINYEKTLAQYQQSLKRLSSFVGFDVSSVDGDFYKVKNISSLDFNNHPEVRFYIKNQEILSYQENYFKALAKPQISVGFITKEPFKNNYEAGFFISATLPVFYRYTGEIVSVKNRKVQYENLTDYTLKNLKIRYETVYKTDEALRQQLDEINKQVIPKLEEQLKLAEKSYKLRVITLFELSSIKNDYFQSLRYRLEVIDSLHKNYSEYIKLGGSVL
jgi:outer membrane protein TolC